jgi:integrase/recombinase XerD
MSDLRQAVTDYLAIRQALGFQLRGYDRLLGGLIEDLQRTGTPTLTTELAVAWATKPAGAQPFRWKTRLSIARGFARYLQTIDPSAQVPPSNLLAYRRARPVPHLYSAAEIDALLAATDMLRPALRAATYRTLLGMLAVTGMRVGELIALDRDDVDLDQGQLAIREAKHATRQLPLHPSTVQALHAYADRRDQICRTPKAPSFLISTAGTRLIYECVRETFITLRRVAGLDHETDPGPRIHEYADLFVMPTSSRNAWRVGLIAA